MHLPMKCSHKKRLKTIQPILWEHVHIMQVHLENTNYMNELPQVNKTSTLFMGVVLNNIVQEREGKTNHACLFCSFFIDMVRYIRKQRR